MQGSGGVGLCLVPHMQPLEQAALPSPKNHAHVQGTACKAMDKEEPHPPSGFEACDQGYEIERWVSVTTGPFSRSVAYGRGCCRSWGDGQLARASKTP